MNSPLPLIEPAYVWAIGFAKINEPLARISPPTEPLLARPSPNCNVEPLLIVVRPVMEFMLVNVSTPAPAAVRVPPPLIAFEKVCGLDWQMPACRRR